MTESIINWGNVLNQSNAFKNNKPFSFAFIEEFLNRDFYEKLYKTYPKVDSTWLFDNGINKCQYSKIWDNRRFELKKIKEDTLSDEWNEFLKYCVSEEFATNFSRFSGIDMVQCKEFGFTYYKQGGFQLPHIHNYGPHNMVMMVYFSKGWQKGDPGGTFVSTEEDESTIIFEPYNLDNSAVIFLDGPNSAHGARYITKNVERRACAINLDKFANGKWSANDRNMNFYDELLEKAKY